jgi:hypothetical protein
MALNIMRREPHAQRVTCRRYFALYAARNIRVALLTTSVMRCSDGGGAA